MIDLQIDSQFFVTCLAAGFTMGTIASLVNITITAIFCFIRSAVGKE